MIARQAHLGAVCNLHHFPKTQSQNADKGCPEVAVMSLSGSSGVSAACLKSPTYTCRCNRIQGVVLRFCRVFPGVGTDVAEYLSGMQ